MSGTKKSGRGSLDKFAPPKKHFCPEHDEECRPTQIGTRKRIRLVCPRGCELHRRATVKR